MLAEGGAWPLAPPLAAARQLTRARRGGAAGRRRRLPTAYPFRAAGRLIDSLCPAPGRVSVCVSAADWCGWARTRGSSERKSDAWCPARTET